MRRIASLASLVCFIILPWSSAFTNAARRPGNVASAWCQCQISKTWFSCRWPFPRSPPTYHLVTQESACFQVLQGLGVRVISRSPCSEATICVFRFLLPHPLPGLFCPLDRSRSCHGPFLRGRGGLESERRYSRGDVGDCFEISDLHVLERFDA